MESAHVEKIHRYLLIPYLSYFETSHTSQREGENEVTLLLLYLKIYLKHSQGCLGLALPFCPWAGGCPQGSCDWWVHCSHPWTAQDTDANRWFGFVILENGLSTPRHPWLGYPASWPLRSTSLWHRPYWVGLSNDLHSSKGLILPRVSDPVPININITIDDFVIKNLATFEVILKNEK